MNRITRSRSIIVLAFVAVVLLGAVPAFATTAAVVTTTAPVPSHAMVGARDLFGLTPTAARAAIATGTAIPNYNPFTVKGNGRVVTITYPKTAVAVNVEVMLAKAYSAVDTITPFAITPAYSIKTEVVSRWAQTVASKFNNRAVNAHRVVAHRAMHFYPEKIGHSVYTGLTYQRIRAAIASEIASSGVHPAAIYAPMRTIQPKITSKNIPKAILVVLGRFDLKLYKAGTLQKSYHCAIGMPGHSTPTGTWKIVRKVKNPSWTNPGSAWAANMPSYIPPGPSNPLGTRALYLNASGIRIHGTYKWWSIGHRASHGCMRMKRSNIEALYPLVPVGTVVYIVK